MWVTCYTDASFGKGGGAWAVWLRSSEGRVVRRGACPKYVNDSTSAELAALFAGLHLSIALWGERVRGVSLRSDSRAALHFAGADARPARNRATRRLQQKIRALLEQKRIELELRWVRGHQPAGSGAASYLNGQCDRLARKTRTKRLRTAR